MPFSDTMNTILSSQNGTSPHVTGNYGEVRKPGPDGRLPGPHGGVDFNYKGGPSGINSQSPTIYSPIDGIVTSVVAGTGTYNTIKIKDKDGNSHEFLHTNSQSVKRGDSVKTGDPIGSMGGYGPKKGKGQFAPHVHYQMKDPQGRRINPQGWWDNGGGGGADQMSGGTGNDIYVTHNALDYNQPTNQQAGGEPS